MQILTKDPMPWRTNQEPRSRRLCAASMKSLSLLLVAGTMMLSACGGSSSGGSTQSATLAGNWQFTLANPDPTYPVGQQYGLEGGFLLEKNGSVTGQAVYSVSNVQNGQTVVCNAGSATITGTIGGTTVNLIAGAGTQTFTLMGTLSSDGSTVTSTSGFTTNGGTPVGGSPCGAATTAGLSWSAVLVPPLTGSITGSFHSGGLPAPPLVGQDFPVTGTFTQGENIDASNATVTGTLNFIDPTTGLNDYPCLSNPRIFVNGEISGNTVVLELIGPDGSNLGQIGIPASQAVANGPQPVTFDSTTSGYVLHSAGQGYTVNTKACPLTAIPGDIGYVCLAFNGTSACQEPVTLSPASLTFSPQLLGSSTTQTITLTNNSADPSKLAVSSTNVYGGLFEGKSDFTGLPSFVVDTSNCASPPVPGASCSINVTFDPQEGCPWLPFPAPPSISGAAPEWCPFPQEATVTVSGTSLDPQTSFTVTATGLGVSAIQPSVSELDFSAEDAASNEQSPPQTLTFTNTGANSVQILPPSTGCAGQPGLPRPPTSAVSGLQVVSNGSGALGNIMPLNSNPNEATVSYFCDIDPGTKLANFQFVPGTDACSGTTLNPGASCSLQVKFVPQPNYAQSNGLDYFLELNTVGEIDSGRFPVELRANALSPLRMSPAAGLDFGIQPVRQLSNPLTITLSNDGTVANPTTVTFVGKIQVSGSSFAELDDCPATLAPGSSCTLTVTFKPSAVGFTAGKLQINYSPEPFDLPQFIYLRGTGQ